MRHDEVPDAMACADTTVFMACYKASFISATLRASLWVSATSISYSSRVVSSHLQPLTLCLFRSGIAKTEMLLEAFFFAESPRPASPPKTQSRHSGMQHYGAGWAPRSPHSAVTPNRKQPPPRSATPKTQLRRGNNPRGSSPPSLAIKQEGDWGRTAPSSSSSCSDPALPMPAPPSKPAWRRALLASALPERRGRSAASGPECGGSGTGTGTGTGFGAGFGAGGGGLACEGSSAAVLL